MKDKFIKNLVNRSTNRLAVTVKPVLSTGVIPVMFELSFNEMPQSSSDVTSTPIDMVHSQSVPLNTSE